MKRNLIVLNLLLALLCGLAIWRFLDVRRTRLAEQAMFLHKREAGITSPAISVPPAPTPGASSAYVQVAEELLLSPDRNPNVVIDVVAPKPMPSLPKAYGSMDFGEGPRVILAEKSGGKQRVYPIGGKIGEFQVMNITQAGVVFDWQGKLVAARYQEMRDLASGSSGEGGSSGRAAAPGPTAASKPAATPASAGDNRSAEVRTIGPTGDVRGKFGTGTGGYRACLKGDDAPDGTVTDGFRKVTVPTPMGLSCHWEKVE